MKKNVQLQVRIETSFWIHLKKQALEKDLTLSELCRQKLKHPHPLDILITKVESLERTVLSEKRKIS